MSAPDAEKFVNPSEPRAYDRLLDGNAITAEIGVRLDTTGIANYGGRGILDYAAIGDVDGDGAGDLAAGSLWALARDFVSIGNFAVFTGLHGAADADSVTPAVAYRPDGTDALLEGFSFGDSGDFDGDGRSEFLVGRDPRAESFGVFEGGHVLHEIQGGTVTPLHRLTTTGGTETNFIGDVNGDGFDDLFVTSLSPGLSHRIVLGNVEGTLDTEVSLIEDFGFQRHTLGLAVSGGQDINEDGLDDIAVLDRGGNGVRIIFGDDRFEDGSSVDSGAGATIVATGTPKHVQLLNDFNGDGLADILISFQGGAALVFGEQTLGGIRNLNDLAPDQGVFLTIDSPNHIARGVGDLNGDGLDDISFTDRNPEGGFRTGVIFGHENLHGDVGFDDLDGTLGFSIGTAETGRAAGDVNGDGFDDLILRAGSGGNAGMAIIHGHATPKADIAPLEEVAPPAPPPGGGDNRIAGGTGSETLTGSEGSDTVSGGDGDDMLIAAAGSDSVEGDGGNDTLRGAYGNDTLRGGDGADVLIGGEGQDMADYSDSGAGVRIFLANSDGFGGTAEGDDLRFIEDLQGSDHADSLFGGLGSNIFHGGLGGDRLSGLEGHDQLFGGAGADRMFGGSARDTLFGGDDGDQLFGGDGIDSLFGDAGDDTLNGGIGGDLMDGGDGDDRLLGRNGDDLLIGADGRDTLLGEAGNDRLSGNAGDDVLTGGDGNDQLRAGLGNDIANGDAGDDLILGASGNDTLSGGDGSDTLAGENDDDLLGGMLGDDLLSGGGGDDELRGGGGTDTLSGGAGADRFVIDGSPEVDTILDFSAAEGDQLVVSGLIRSLDEVLVAAVDGGILVTTGKASFVLADLSVLDFDPTEGMIF